MKTPVSKLRSPPGNALRFVILIPHRDMAGPLRSQSRALFAAGVLGAGAFPLAAPLALVSRPLNPGELKSLAAVLREESLKKSGPAAGNGKISLLPPALGSCPGFPHFFGPLLDLSPPPPYPGTLYPFTSLILCTALADAAGEIPPAGMKLPPMAPSFFRAAMVANLVIKPLSAAAPGPSPDGEAPYSFAWRIGPPHWLPSPSRIKKPGPAIRTPEDS